MDRYGYWNKILHVDLGERPEARLRLEGAGVEHLDQHLVRLDPDVAQRHLADRQERGGHRVVQAHGLDAGALIFEIARSRDPGFEVRARPQSGRALAPFSRAYAQRRRRHAPLRRQ